jgi:hypothetical protein
MASSWQPVTACRVSTNPYQKLGLQEMNFREEFEEAICLDALEHICLEDYPGILRRFR